MREVFAILRSSWLVSTSYRLNFLISLAAVAVGIVPLYFIANAIQPIAAESIRDEGGQYFAFVLTGMMTFRFLQAGVDALPKNISGAIGSGTLEALLNTPARMPMLLAGFALYPVLWTALSAALMLIVGSVMGAQLAWSHFGLAVPILLLTILAYIPFGLISAAAILVFRTPTPLANGVLMVSMVLGGVYYSTSVIPSWLGGISSVVPLTYGLRALRRVMIEGVGLAEVAGDVGVLLLFTTVLLAIGVLAFSYGMTYSRRAGTLSHY